MCCYVLALSLMFLSRVSSSSACSLLLISSDRLRVIPSSSDCWLYSDAMMPPFLLMFTWFTHSSSLTLFVEGHPTSKNWLNYLLYQWHGLIVSSSTISLPRWALIPLCQLSTTSTSVLHVYPLMLTAEENKNQLPSTTEGINSTLPVDNDRLTL